MLQATPDSVNATLVHLEKLANDELQATGIPGLAIVVVYKDKTVFARGLGVREAGKPDPVDADTVFQLASMSKPIGSTIIAALQKAIASRWLRGHRSKLSH